MTASTVFIPIEHPQSDDLFNRALAAEPRLRAVDRMVRLIAARAPSKRSGKPQCAGCIWSGILKPLVRPLVGWSRGEERQAREGSAGWQVFTRSDLEKLTTRRRIAENDTECWLRSGEAYDAVTSRWMAILDKADPANGHGLPG